MSGPIASRTARTRATIASGFPGATRVFMARNPVATKSAASRCNSSIEEESHKPPLAYTGTPAARGADEPANIELGRLATQIPQRHVDPGHCLDRHALVAKEIQLLPRPRVKAAAERRVEP